MKLLSKIHVPIYDVIVYLSNDAKLASRKIQKLTPGVDLKDDLPQYDVAGFSAELQNNNSEVIAYLIVCQEDETNTVTHESLHCAMDILHSAGIEYNYHNQESLAYLAGYLSKQWWLYIGAHIK